MATAIYERGGQTWRIEGDELPPCVTGGPTPNQQMCLTNGYLDREKTSVMLGLRAVSGSNEVKIEGSCGNCSIYCDLRAKPVTT